MYTESYIYSTENSGNYVTYGDHASVTNYSSIAELEPTETFTYLTRDVHCNGFNFLFSSDSYNFSK